MKETGLKFPNCQNCGVPISGRRKRNCTKCIPDYKALRRYNSFGVSQPMWDAMYFENDGHCAICLKQEATHVDHDHETGKVRGILCHHCNAGLGLFKDDVATLERAKLYVTCQL